MRLPPVMNNGIRPSSFQLFSGLLVAGTSDRSFED